VDLRGRTLAVFGCGTIGLFTILMARAMGATTIIGVDPNEKNLKLAGELGADEVLCVPGGSVHGVEHAPDLEVVEAIRKRCFGEGVDVAFEMSGSNQALNTAIASTRAGGDIILFGLSAGDYTITNFQEIILYGKSMHSVVGRKVFQTWYTMRNLLTSKEHNLQDRIYDVILNKGDGTVMPFHQFNRNAFEQAIQEYPKIVLKYR
jgi:threonine 3-dehydrogenase